MPHQSKSETTYTESHITCPHHGTNVWIPTTSGLTQAGVCQHCDPDRHMHFLKTATTITPMSEEKKTRRYTR